MGIKVAVVQGLLAGTTNDYTDFTETDFGTVTAAIVITNGAYTTGNPGTVGVSQGIGFYKVGGNQYSCETILYGGQADATSRRMMRSGYAATITFAGASYTERYWEASSVTNGIRLTQKGTTSTATRYATVILFGGTTNVHVGYADLANGSTSATNVTAPGFRADFVAAASIGLGSANFAALGNDGSYSFGFAKIADNDTVTQRMVGWGHNNAEADVEAATIIRDNAIVGQYFDFNPDVGESWYASLSANANGFTLTPSADPVGDTVLYLAIESDPDDFDVSDITAATSTGDDDHTGLAFTPQALILGQTILTSTNSLDNTSAGFLALGAANGSGGRAYRLRCQDGALTNDAESYVDTSNVLNICSDAGTVNAVADVSEFASGSYTLTYSDAASSAWKLLAVAIGDSTATGGTTVTGTGALTLPGVTASGSGAVERKGTGALGLPALTLTAAGVREVTGTGALSLPLPVIDGTGAVSGEISGTGALALAALTASGTGAVERKGTGALTLPSTTVAGTGTRTITGTGALDLYAPTVSGTGTVSAAGTHTGTGAITLPGAAVSGAGAVERKGTGAIDLPAPTVAGTGVREAVGTGALDLPAVTVAGEGRLATEVTGTGDLTLPGVTVSGTNIVAFAGGGLRGKRKPARRSREYEEYLRALAEGREYVPPGAEDEPPPKAPKKRKPARKPAAPVFPALPVYAGDFLADLAAQPAIAAVIELEAYRTYQEAYAAARMAALMAEDEELMMLLVA